MAPAESALQQQRAPDAIDAEISALEQSLSRSGTMNAEEIKAHQLAQQMASLEEQVERATVQLSNADKLIGGLGGEAKSWEEQVRRVAQAEDAAVARLQAAKKSGGPLSLDGGDTRRQERGDEPSGAGESEDQGCGCHAVSASTRGSRGGGGWQCENDSDCDST